MSYNKKSEIAYLRQQIVEELEAMQRNFTSFTAGVARHDFIRARMQRVGEHQDRLAEVVGQSNATCIACELYIDIVKR